MKESVSFLQKGFILDEFILLAMKEDLFPPPLLSAKASKTAGDHTSASMLPSRSRNKASLIIKENGILAGVELAVKIFHFADKNLRVSVKKYDGAKVKKGDVAFTVEGKAGKILSTERLVLNCMQRMSGIATLTHKMTELCKPYKVKITDTRKTTPLFRALEKWAVRIGGGHNHRFGLYDMLLIKNNHIDFAGGIKRAILSANEYLRRKKLNLEIEIEARNLTEVNEIISTGKVNRILLDNFSIPEIKKAVKIIDCKFEVEISGGINEKNILKYTPLGADYISSGALTHSAKSLNMSLTADTKR